MHEIQFRKRIYANPNALDQETLDAVRASTDYQKILDETREMESALDSLLNHTGVPPHLADKLLAITAIRSIQNDVATTVSSEQNYFGYYAMAACLLLAIGVTVALSFNRGPSFEDMVFGEDIIAHLYEEEFEAINAINNGSFEGTVSVRTANESIENVGIQLKDSDSTQRLVFRSARLCEIFPAFRSAHLLVQGTQGAVSVIIINNSPVDAEFSIADNRFNGVVIPMGEGNMILVGEKNENLDQYITFFSNNADLII